MNARLKHLDCVRTVGLIIVLFFDSLQILRDRTQWSEDPWSNDRVKTYISSIEGLICILFSNSGEVAAIKHAEPSKKGIRQSFTWYMEKIIIEKTKRLIIPVFVVSYLLLVKVQAWLKDGHTFEDGFTKAWMTNWQLSFSWFLVFLHSIFLANGFEILHHYNGSLGMASFVGLCIIYPLSVLEDGTIPGCITAPAFLAPYFVSYAFKGMKNWWRQWYVWVQFATLVLCTVACSYVYETYGNYQGKIINAVTLWITMNHFFLSGVWLSRANTHPLPSSFRCFGMLCTFAGMVLCVYKEPFPLHKNFVFRPLCQWVWLAAARLVAQGCFAGDNGQDDYTAVERIVHDSALYIYILHIPLMEAFKFILFVPEKWHIFAASALLVPLAWIASIILAVMLHWAVMECYNRACIIKRKCNDRRDVDDNDIYVFAPGTDDVALTDTTNFAVSTGETTVRDVVMAV